MDSETVWMALLVVMVIGGWGFLFWQKKKENLKKKNTDNILSAISVSKNYSITSIASSCRLSHIEVIKTLEKAITTANSLSSSKKNGDDERYRFLKNAHLDFNRDKIVFDEDLEISVSAKTAIPGTEMIADALGGTVDAFKDALGFKSKKSSTESIEKIAKKCSSCGATISGKKGQLVHCSYCDADQQL